MKSAQTKNSGKTTFSLHKHGFTLIELLVVIAIIGILAGAILVAINPAKRAKQARDAQRKQDINSIANALVGYYILTGGYPYENTCDSSIGSDGLDICDYMTSPSTNWNTTAIGYIYQGLITNQSFLKELPKDPKNNIIYYYNYEPNTCTLTCNYYWIGARLEDEGAMTTEYLVFRCSDDPSLLAGMGCKEVKYPSSKPLGSNSPL